MWAKKHLVTLQQFVNVVLRDLNVVLRDLNGGKGLAKPPGSLSISKYGARAHAHTHSRMHNHFLQLHQHVK
jgi:hypothetical protein